MAAAKGCRRVSPAHRWSAHSALVVACGVLLALAVLGVTGPRLDAARAGVVAADRREPPDVVGLTLPEAQTRIEREWYPGASGLKPTIIITPDIPDQVAPEAARVVEQTVLAYLDDTDDVKPSAVIQLTVGSTVANLVGRTREEAEGLLDPLGLYLKPSGEGLVQTQDPKAKRLVPFGTTVVARLATPSSPALRVVPPLDGLTEAESRARVEGVDLRLRVTESSGEGQPTVVEQDPAGGTQLAAGGVVDVTLRGSAVVERTVVVPDVTGLDPAAVQRVLAGAKLVMVLDPSGSPVQDEGLSYRQDPQPGGRVIPGTSVTVAFAAAVQSAPVAVWAWPTAAAAMAILVLAWWSLHLLRRRRLSRPHRSPTPADIAVDPHPDPAPEVSVRSVQPATDLAFRVVPTADPGTLTVAEEAP